MLMLKLDTDTKPGQSPARKEKFPRVLIEALSYLTIFSSRLESQGLRRVERSLFPMHYLTFLLVHTHTLFTLFKLLWISLKESPVPGLSLTLSLHTHTRGLLRERALSKNKHIRFKAGLSRTCTHCSQTGIPDP